MIGESKGTEAPGERQLLHLESIFGGQPDPTRPQTISQLFDAVASERAEPSPVPHQLPDHLSTTEESNVADNSDGAAAMEP